MLGLLLFIGITWSERGKHSAETKATQQRRNVGEILEPVILSTHIRKQYQRALNSIFRDGG